MVRQWTKEYLNVMNSMNFDSSSASNWESFDEYKQKEFAAVHTTLNRPIHSYSWMNGTCDCSDFFKLFYCQHVIGTAIRSNVVSAPEEAKNIPIGQKR